jgi:AcrR family transcriptional regulator
VSVITKRKIVGVAETLFAENGFKDTSLRSITRTANVNLAAVNYHFGDKKNLIRAVLDKYLAVFMPLLDGELQKLPQDQVVDMNTVLFCLRTPLKGLDSQFPQGASRFLLLCGRGYTESQGHLRWFIMKHYGDVVDKFVNAVHQANPNLDREVLYWRLHFTLGTCIFTMASSEALLDIANSEFGSNSSVDSILQQIVPFLAAGMCADVTSNTNN